MISTFLLSAQLLLGSLSYTNYSTNYYIEYAPWGNGGATGAVAPPHSNVLTFTFWASNNYYYYIQAKTGNLYPSQGCYLRYWTNEFGVVTSYYQFYYGTDWVDCSGKLEGQGRSITVTQALPWETLGFLRVRALRK